MSGWLETAGPEARYLILVVGLFVVPRALQRWRIPSAISSLGIGALLGAGLGLFHDDQIVPVLATIGIVSLFLFAGLEVEVSELRTHAAALSVHAAMFAAVVALVAVAASRWLFLGPQASVLFALALLTPSTGFILDSLPGFGLAPESARWVKTNAIAIEILALFALFVTVQADDGASLALSSLAMVAMVALLPIVLRFFADVVLPHAPGTELSLLLVVALVCASVTRLLGVYYLVGAFVVGVVAVRLRRHVPALASARVQSALELFATFFVPFYFFKAGLHLPETLVSPRALALGAALLAVVLPVRVLLVALVHRGTAGQPLAEGARLGTALVPTLVFTLVLGDILAERFGLDADLHGALAVFTIVNTMLPGFLLRACVRRESALSEPALPSAEPGPT
jgi:Kef-type K+ transport system membrane component KefB